MSPRGQFQVPLNLLPFPAEHPKSKAEPAEFCTSVARTFDRSSCGAWPCNGVICTGAIATRTRRRPPPTPYSPSWAKLATMPHLKVRRARSLSSKRIFVELFAVSTFFISLHFLCHSRYFVENSSVLSNFRHFWS